MELIADYTKHALTSKVLSYAFYFCHGYFPSQLELGDLVKKQRVKQMILEFRQDRASFDDIQRIIYDVNKDPGLRISSIKQTSKVTYYVFLWMLAFCKVIIG